MAGTRWSREEDALVTDLTKSIPDLAKQFGRTPHAVNTRRYVLRQSLKSMPSAVIPSAPLLTSSLEQALKQLLASLIDEVANAVVKKLRSSESDKTRKIPRQRRGKNLISSDQIS